MPATSHVAARAGRCARTILGSRRAVWAQRTKAGLSGSGSARSSPLSGSNPVPYMTGLRLLVIEPPKISAATWASVVQPAWASWQA